MVPSALSLNGAQSPVLDSAGVLLKHMCMKMPFMVSTPPTIAMSAWPSHSSLAPIWSAANVEAHAASVTQLVPCRSRRLAMRPATTLPSRPGNVASCQGA